ncbi:hypothetical protein D3C72_946780 [compost metagenome]
MNQDHGRGGHFERCSQDLFDVDGRMVGRARRPMLLAHQDIAFIEVENPELFPGKMGQGDPEIVHERAPGRQNGTPAGQVARHGRSQRSRSGDVGDRRVGKSLSAQDRACCRRHPGEGASSRKQPSTDETGALGAQPRFQKSCQDFKIGMVRPGAS